MYAKRLKAGKPLDEVILHAGGVHGDGKQEQMELLNCWRVAEWDIAWGNRHLNQASQIAPCMTSQMQSEQKVDAEPKCLGQPASLPVK